MIKVIERVFNEQERAEQQERERVHKEKEEERQARIALQVQSQPVSVPKAIQQRAAPRDVSPVVPPQGDHTILYTNLYTLLLTLLNLFKFSLCRLLIEYIGVHVCHHIIVCCC
jgi:Flp pilus assembly protein TadB